MEKDTNELSNEKVFEKFRELRGRTRCWGETGAGSLLRSSFSLLILSFYHFHLSKVFSFLKKYEEHVSRRWMKLLIRVCIRFYSGIYFSSFYILSRESNISSIYKINLLREGTNL